MATVGQVPWGSDPSHPPSVVRTQAYLTANPTLPDVPNNTIVFITP